MNLRIDEQQLRFRITGDELALLISGEQLLSRTDLGETKFCYSISLVESDIPLNFNSENNVWHLKVGKKALNEFAKTLPSRDGIENEICPGASPITLVLEVDVRRAKK